MNIERQAKFVEKLTVMAQYLPDYESNDFRLLEDLLGIDPDVSKLIETTLLPTVDKQGEFYLTSLARIATKYNFPRLAEKTFIYCIDMGITLERDMEISALAIELININNQI